MKLSRAVVRAMSAGLLVFALCFVAVSGAAGQTTQLIVNGGFQTGTLSSWTAATGTLAPTVSTTQTYGGSYSALLGKTAKPEIDGNSSIYQTVAIPVGSTATLSYWYWPSTTDTISYAWQEAQIQNTSGTTLAEVMKAASNTKTWTQVTYNLTPAAGQAIRVYFNAHGNGYSSDNVYMYLDDVAVTVTSPTPAFTLAASPSSVSVAAGSSGTSTITTTVSGGFSNAVALTASGQPSGVSVSFNPTPIATPGSGTSTMTLAIASTVTTGTYPITVTGTGGGLTQTASFSLTVTAAAAPGFSISASPSSLSVADGGSGSPTITSSVTGGFSSAIALTSSGQPTGVTVAFNPTSITGAGSSVTTITVASTATAGTYPITITGTSGSTIETTSVSLTVTSGSYFSLVTLPNQGLASTYAFIKSATKSIDMVMYELTDTTASGDLVTMGQNGVKVRVILDQNDEKSANTPAYNQLKGATNVSVVWANPKYEATHEKSIVVNDSTALIMTYNLTSQYYSTSRDFGVFDTDPNDVAAIETTFNADFVYGTITPPDGDDLIWSPTNSGSSLLALINNSTTSLQVENEEMSSSAIVSALGSAAKRGVSCTIIMTANSDYTSELNTLNSDGCKIATYAETASLYIHAKVILADYGTSTAKVYIGSENFSTASLTENRELGLIISDPATMTSINTTLTSDYNGGTPY
ncbi:MAG: phospholipase D-like domain-containing protein [Candidatus Acidiferrales bacterium]